MREVGHTDSRGKSRYQTEIVDESETVQSDAHLADINTIMRDFAQSGLSALDEADLMFKDVSEFTDLQDALAQAAVAEEHFLKLPSKVREIFNHDVAVWLDTAHDEDKRDALVEAGFIKAPEVLVADEPKVVADPPKAGGAEEGGTGSE